MSFINTYFQEESSESLSFVVLLGEIASFFGVEDFAPQNQNNRTEELVGNIELSKETGDVMRLQIEQESIGSWSALRATVIIELQEEEKEWLEQSVILKALLLTRILPGTFFPLACSCGEDALQFHCLIPFDGQAKELLLTLVSFISTFYETLLGEIRDKGVTTELITTLKATDRASDTVWTLGAWGMYKAVFSRYLKATETYSSAGHYYRLLAPTETKAGMIAINLGNVTDFIDLDHCFLFLLRLNAISFFADNYYSSIDDREGLLLLALLPPTSHEESKQHVERLLERAQEVRTFLLKITDDLESFRIQEAVKDITDLEELVLT